MAKGPSYNVPYRRRREGKTNYRLRKKLIASGLPRLVVRKSQRYITLQLINSATIGDEVITSTNSSELRKKYGWLGGLNNLSAAYLTGLLCGYRAKTKGVKKAILDIGLRSPSRGAHVFAALKGLVDAGVEVPHSKENLPEESRIMGQHIADYAAKISADTDVYSRIFSEYLSRGLSPQEIPKHFLSVKETIISKLKEIVGK